MLANYLILAQVVGAVSVVLSLTLFFSSVRIQPIPESSTFVKKAKTKPPKAPSPLVSKYKRRIRVLLRKFVSLFLKFTTPMYLMKENTHSDHSGIYTKSVKKERPFEKETDEELLAFDMDTLHVPSFHERPKRKNIERTKQKRPSIFIDINGTDTEDEEPYEYPYDRSNILSLLNEDITQKEIDDINHLLSTIKNEKK